MKVVQLSDLLNMDGGAAIDWLCENAHTYTLIETGTLVMAEDHERCIEDEKYERIELLESALKQVYALCGEDAQIAKIVNETLK